MGSDLVIFEPDSSSTAALIVAYDGLTRVRTGILGHGVTEKRDALRRVATVTNALGQATAGTYDPEHRRVRMSAPATQAAPWSTVTPSTAGAIPSAR
ncbi:hypothetical protein [Nitrosovibrio sp. Nv17]|uniref:hypothetical protein n=1 Tax=Nitrosovibrio sp. Nv17 TaxID=1855339 RepID=UPI0009087DB9|nr:hypothetical protein [Nitrosovibrio sp. Nv17]SFW11708.1 YD repeat-containing protein [Nitrosovibrio sp. Nv17]